MGPLTSLIGGLVLVALIGVGIHAVAKYLSAKDRKALSSDRTDAPATPAREFEEKIDG